MVMSAWLSSIVVAKSTCYLPVMLVSKCPVLNMIELEGVHWSITSLFLLFLFSCVLFTRRAVSIFERLLWLKTIFCSFFATLTNVLSLAYIVEWRLLRTVRGLGAFNELVVLFLKCWLFGVANGMTQSVSVIISRSKLSFAGIRMSSWQIWIK